MTPPNVPTVDGEKGSAEPSLSRRMYLSAPHMGPAERDLLLDAFDSNWIAPLGPHVDAFEQETADLVGVQHAAALSSGTAAIHLALLLAGVRPKDSVWVSSLTFVASAAPVSHLGATPVFLDCDQSWTLDPSLLEDSLRKADQAGTLPKAIIPVDLYGQVCDYAAICEAAARYEIPVLADAAEALGSSVGSGDDRRMAGSHGDLAVLSFNGNKIITTSGGGMLLGASREQIEKARFLATQARDPALHYQHSQIGFNYRLSNLLAAVGRGQLKVLEERIEKKRLIADRYQAGLSDLPGVTFLAERENTRTNRWLSVMTIDSDVGVEPADLCALLGRRNAEARPVWKPMHMQPVYENHQRYGGEAAERFFRRGVCLPSWTQMTEGEQDQIIVWIRQLIERGK